jgi:hypothetical protein
MIIPEEPERAVLMPVFLPPPLRAASVSTMYDKLRGIGEEK